MTEVLRSIGKNIIRKDAWDKAAGTALYTADIQDQDIKIGRIVRSPHHFARILGINREPALKIDGVLAVLTADDIPGEKTFGPLIPDQPSLAIDTARHLGEPVALVIAETNQAAEQAVSAIEVNYQPITPVFDPERALETDAPKVHKGGNLVSDLDISSGDMQSGWEGADKVLEGVFELPRIHPGYMEPETSLARREEDGTVTVWVSSQHPFVDQ